jgi:hypothetical protein
MTDQFHASWNGLGIVEEREIDIWVNGEDILEMFRRADLRKATKAGGKSSQSNCLIVFEMFVCFHRTFLFAKVVKHSVSI